MSNQTRRRQLADCHVSTTRQRSATVLSLDSKRQRLADDRHTRDLLLSVAAPCPGRRPHWTFNAIASKAHFEERGIRPWETITGPVDACLDELLAHGTAGQIRACREHFRAFLDHLAERFDRRIPAAMRAQVTGVPMLPMRDAYAGLVKEEGEALAANAEAAAKPGDRFAAERAARETADVETAARLWRAALAGERSDAPVTRST